MVGVKLFISHFPRYHCILISDVQSSLNCCCAYFVLFFHFPFFFPSTWEDGSNPCHFLCVCQKQKSSNVRLWNSFIERLRLIIYYPLLVFFFLLSLFFVLFDYYNDWILCPIYLIYSHSLNYFFSGNSNWNSNIKLEN